MGIQFLIKFYPRASQWEDKFYEFLFVIIAGERRIKGRSENYVLSFSMFIYVERFILFQVMNRNQGIKDYSHRSFIIYYCLPFTLVFKFHVV